MEKKIDVYLQYPWKYPDSPYYKYLIDSPPKAIKYLNVKKQKGAIIKRNTFIFLVKIKRILRKSLNFLKFSVPNSHLSPNRNYDLIHCAHCLSKNKDKPWIADFESVWQMFIGMKNKRSMKKVRKLLLSKNCKKIIAWTKVAQNDILKILPEIKDKLEVVYPAIPSREKSSKKGGKITILYATRYFWLKGGIIALEVFRKLKQKYGDEIELIFISDVPEKAKANYPKLDIRSLVTQKELLEIYKKSDIFFYPSFVDTFGFGLLEAMSFGLPIVTVNTGNTRTRKEIIENNKNGFIFDIDEPLKEKLLKEKGNLVIGSKEIEIINKLFDNCCKLIDNKKLRNKISSNCIEMIKNGKFSIEKRNKKLEEIYENAIK